MNLEIVATSGCVEILEIHPFAFFPYDSSILRQHVILLVICMNHNENHNGMSHFVPNFCTRTQIFFHFLLQKLSNIHKNTENSTVNPHVRITHL